MCTLRAARRPQGKGPPAESDQLAERGGAGVCGPDSRAEGREGTKTGHRAALGGVQDRREVAVPGQRLRHSGSSTFHWWRPTLHGADPLQPTAPRGPGPRPWTPEEPQPPRPVPAGRPGGSCCAWNRAAAAAGSKRPGGRGLGAASRPSPRGRPPASELQPPLPPSLGPPRTASPTRSHTIPEASGARALTAAAQLPPGARNGCGTKGAWLRRAPSDWPRGGATAGTFGGGRLGNGGGAPA